MRMFKSLIALLLAVSLISPAQATETFTFVGSGYGHGVGLSQIGGKAMALEGKTAEEILKYYYTGVEVAPVSDWYDLRINVGNKLNSATLQLISDVGYLMINAVSYTVVPDF